MEAWARRIAYADIIAYIFLFWEKISQEKFMRLPFLTHSLRAAEGEGLR